MIKIDSAFFSDHYSRMFQEAITELAKTGETVSQLGVSGMTTEDKVPNPDACVQDLLAKFKEKGFSFLYDGRDYDDSHRLTEFFLKQEEEGKFSTRKVIAISDYGFLFLVFQNSGPHANINVWTFITAPKYKEISDMVIDWFKTNTVVSIPRKKSTKIPYNLLIRTMRGIDKRAMMLSRKPFIAENYSQEVRNLFPEIVKTFTAKEPNGRLVILEGPPGTGKSHFVRALVTEARKKCQFFIINAPDIAEVAKPEYIVGLMDMCSPHIANVFILEDAEKALAPRQVVTRKKQTVDADAGAINALLSMTDGLYGEGLNLRVLATTNAQIDSFDPALLRRGRLAHHLRIGALSRDEANARFQQLTGEDLAPEFSYSRPTTIGDIYYDVQKKKGK